MLPTFIYHWPRSPSKPVTRSDSSVSHSSHRALGQQPLVREGEGVWVGSLVNVGVGVGPHGWMNGGKGGGE